jgi:hypothetical protein
MCFGSAKLHAANLKTLNMGKNSLAFLFMKDKLRSTIGALDGSQRAWVIRRIQSVKKSGGVL